ncbi:hypothetical protein KEM56_007294 [Ascosphaera pollenicola]|nr:hypothetical protein KEM56_007294 [Ascosphaera pollenicola]
MSTQDGDPDYTEQPEDLSDRESSEDNAANVISATKDGAGTSRQSRPKRVSELERNARAEKRRLLIDRYVSLFNDAVRDLESGVVYDDGASTQHERIRQYGAVRWTRRERDAFYNGLAKYSKGETAKIASLIGTKSEMEVRALIQAFDRNAQHRATRHREPGFLALKDIPAALEVSTACCKAMEESAHALALNEESRESLMGYKNYGDLYTIDGAIAAWVEEKLGSVIKADEELLAQNEDADDDDDDDDEIIEEKQLEDLDSKAGRSDEQASDIVEDSVIFTVGRLFKLSNWIKLSENIFMNPGNGCHQEDNWRTLFKEETPPALTCEAFSDFYALAISLTRRIIQSAIFFALSRARALERAGINVRSQTYVRKQDVLAALDILRLPRDSHDFWALSARRCNLDIVYDRHRKSYHVTQLSHDQVERLLLPRDRKTRSVEEHSIRALSQGQQNAAEVVLDPHSHVEDSRVETDSTADEEQEQDDSEDQEQEEGGNPEFESPSDYEDNIAEKLDKQAAAQEDFRLREQLNLPKPAKPAKSEAIMKLENNTEPELGPYSHPLNYRKSKEELADWRDRLLYYSEWEQYGPKTRDVVEETGHQQKRQRLT